MSGPTLFSKPPEYTIDTCCFLEIFRESGRHSRKVYHSFWSDLCELIEQGTIISHIEVYKEIDPGDDLHKWAAGNKEMFKDYDLPIEGTLIKSLLSPYKDFVNAKVKGVHADPWLIAQAKNQGLKIITEEVRTTGSIPKPAKMKIPDVCADPTVGVRCITLFELIKERGWTY